MGSQVFSAPITAMWFLHAVCTKHVPRWVLHYSVLQGSINLSLLLATLSLLNKHHWPRPPQHTHSMPAGKAILLCIIPHHLQGIWPFSADGQFVSFVIWGRYSTHHRHLQKAV